jgi:hypothetical protein
MAKTTVSYRMSYAVIVFFIGALAGLSLPILFGIAGVLEILMAILLSYETRIYEEILPYSFYGILAVQYAHGEDVDPLEMIHMVGGRVLACSLGLFAVWWYIPTILIYLSTCIDIKYKRRP